MSEADDLALEDRIAALESDGTYDRIIALEKSLRLLADDWRKQRVVNEALLDSAQYLPITGERLAAALREALK